MNILKFCGVLLITILSCNAHADKSKFLTVDELVEQGYKVLSGLQILEIMADHTIRVVDIETGAEIISNKKTSEEAMDRKFVETKTDKKSLLFDARLMARAPALEGKIERKVVGDQLVSTDGLRTYRHRLYEKEGRIFAVRDIDHGNVFFEVK